MPLIQNFQSCAFAAEPYDELTIDQMARRMDINHKVARKIVDKRRDLSLKAWRNRQNPEAETTKAYHRYEEVFSHAGQFFYNNWHDVNAAFALSTGMKDARTLDEAIKLVYGG